MSGQELKPKLKVGDSVEDRWYPDWGKGKVMSVHKTRYSIFMPSAPELMKNKFGNVVYDIPHANQFLQIVEKNKEPNRCDWAVEGMRVKIIRTDIRPLHKMNTTKEGIITRIDGGYIYVKPLYQPKLSLELYINEIRPGKGYENVKKEWDKRFNRALKALGKSLRETT